MRDFTKLNPAIFDDARFLSLGWESRCVYLYLMGGKHQTSAGCYRIPDGYAATDLKCDPSEYEAARKAVADTGLILFDEETAEVYVSGWYNENPICNPKHAAGTEQLILLISSELIQNAAYEDFSKSKEAFEEAFATRTSRAGGTVSRLGDTALVRNSSVGGRAFGS